MTKYLTQYEAAGRKLMDLLCRMADVDRPNVTSISVHCSIKDVVRFDVQLIGEADRITAALSGEDAEPRLPYNAALRSEIVKQFEARPTAQTN